MRCQNVRHRSMITALVSSLTLAGDCPYPTATDLSYPKPRCRGIRLAPASPGGGLRHAGPGETILFYYLAPDQVLLNDALQHLRRGGVIPDAFGVDDGN